MAENVQISLGVKSDTKQAEKNVESLKRALSSLQAVAARVGEGDSITKYAVQVKSAANTIKSVVNQSNIGKAMDKFADTPSLKNLDNVASSLTKELTRAEKAEKEFAKSTEETGKAADDAGKQISKTNGIFSNFFGSLTRIAKLRLLRGIIRAVTQAFKEGTENIYQYSVALGRADASHFASTMDSLASSFLYLKNAVGAAVAPILSALVPALQTVISWVALALDYLAQFFAVINGQSTYTKAKKTASTWKDVGSAIGGAAAAAKEYQNTILGFDELNVLNDTSSGGGGGGGGASGPNYTDMFEEVELPKNIFTSLGKLFSKDGIIGKGLSFVKDIGTFVTEALSPALSYIWGTLTGDIEMCNQAWKELQEAIASNSTAQMMIGHGMEVYQWVSNAIDDIRLWFWNAVEDVTEFLRPLLELMGWDVDDNIAKIEAQKKAIKDHKRETEDAVEWFKLWMTGMDEAEAATVVSLDRVGKEATTIAKDVIRECTNEKKSVDNVKTSAYYASDAWGAYAIEVAKAQQKTYTGSNVTGGLSNIVDWLDKVLLKFTSLNEKLGLTGLNFNNAKSMVGGAVNGFYANGGFVGSYANGGIIPRFDGGGIRSADLFMANENANPELVARIGNRTAVANQGQMIEMVTGGVARGVAEAMNNGNSNIEVVVNMDGVAVARAADRGNRSLNRRFAVSLT